jgi:putative CocE/NonD family hydrolase
VRNDVLVYTSEPFAHPCLLAGAIELRLYAATTAPDTDWTAKLVDVHPDGRAININDGIMRARYRRSLERAELLEPERVYEYTIAVGAAGWRVAPGHRLRLEVSSSNFPMYDRNPNTGHPLGEDAISDLRTATQTVYHEQAYPSRVIIRIFES